MFFFYAPCAYTFSFPKNVQIHRNKDREGLAIASSQFNAPAGPQTGGPSVRNGCRCGPARWRLRPGAVPARGPSPPFLKVRRRSAGIPRRWGPGRRSASRRAGQRQLFLYGVGAVNVAVVLHIAAVAPHLPHQRRRLEVAQIRTFSGGASAPPSMTAFRYL